MGEATGEESFFPGYGLIGYAEHEFQLNARQKDGSSLREHLESVRQQTGRMPPQLNSVELPYCVAYLWRWFCDLSGSRGYAEHGPMALSYQELFAWTQLMKTEPTAWEISALKMIDRIFLQEAMKK